MDETVGESGSAGAEAPVPPSRGQEAEQVVCGVTCVAHNCGGFSGEAGGLDVLQRG